MKIALKYGVPVTLVIAAWVALKHFVLHLQGPGAQLSDVAVFNFSAIVGLMMGIKEKRLANGNKLTFGDGFLTGLGIAITFAILTSLYFVLHLQGPGAQLSDVAVFNFSAIVGLMMGIKEKRLANGNKLTFGDGFLT